MFNRSRLSKRRSKINTLTISRIINKIFNIKQKISFSQSGEDIIIKFLIDTLKKEKVRYFDIGTNHPVNLNNTYLLYLMGFQGVCIEPDPQYKNLIRKFRPRDIYLACGITPGLSGRADYFLMDDHSLNTFSGSGAKDMVDLHHKKIIKTVKVPLLNINELLKKYFDHKAFTILSVDVEGLDYDVVSSIDFNAYRPDIFCIETLSYSTDLSGNKDSRFTRFMEAMDYKLYADTYINSIFIDKRHLAR